METKTAARGCGQRLVISQSTATASAAHSCRIRSPDNLPSRSTSTATVTLSIESKFTAQRRGTGSAPGSSSTSLGRPRTVVVQGATRARRSLGIAVSRDSTTTGRRPIWGNSHHHTSARLGSAVTRRPPPAARRRDHPIRPADRLDIGRKPRSSHQARRPDNGRATPEALRPPRRHRCFPSAASVLLRGGLRRRSCSIVCGSCHNYATGGAVRNSPRQGLWIVL
jgi:hypothetical protein